MKRQKILFVDDEKAGRQVALYNLREAGYAVEEAEDGAEALRAFHADKFDLVITDVRMPELSGIELLKRIRSSGKDIPVLVITAYGSIETAVEAMKLGAEDFIVKPFNRDQLILAVERALERRELRCENRRLKVQLIGVERPIIHKSKAIKELIGIADRVAASDAAVLITGESGTGKELFARRIHVQSKRAEQPFIVINCGAIPPDLLESELFGHTKGAFTGAVKERVGRFRQADGGTIFLDEVGELPPTLQVKLLRVLQEQLIDVVGQDEPVGVDVRIISATNKNLEERIKEGSFREDLFYRLDVVNLRVPPLREHREDIPLLVGYFLEQFGAGRELTVSDELLARLTDYGWPGNVRELENVCKRLVILCEGTELRLLDLPPQLLLDSEKNSGSKHKHYGSHSLDLPDDGLSLIDLEKDIILKVLERKNWNVSQASAYLGVPRHVLAYRMEKYGIRRK